MVVLIFIMAIILMLANASQGFILSSHRVVRSDPLSTSRFGLVDEESLVFGGIRLTAPLSKSLKKMKVKSPTPIQNQALVPLLMGSSCIIHAQTGSGKTLCYLLPLLKKLLSSTTLGLPPAPVQAMIVVPTKELAIQVAVDIVTLLQPELFDNDQGQVDARMIHLCLDSSSSSQSFEDVKAPIVIGTPFPMRDKLKMSQKKALNNMSYLVIDEVDHMLQVASKYASNDKKKLRRTQDNALSEFLVMLSKVRQYTPPSSKQLREGTGVDRSGMQVVAASATVGRPMKRELFRVLAGGKPYSERGAAGELPVLFAASRPAVGTKAEAAAEFTEPEPSSEVEQRGLAERDDELYDLEELFIDQYGASDREPLGRQQADDAHDAPRRPLPIAKKQQRAVSIPAAIRHVLVLLNDDGATPVRGHKEMPSPGLAGKLAVAKKIWQRPPLDRAHKAVLFVPTNEDVAHALGVLHFWGLSTELFDLRGSLGLGDKSRHPPQSGQKEGRGNPKFAERLSSAELVRRGVRQKLGGSAGAAEAACVRSGGARQFIVLPVSGMRGLHIADVDVVLVARPPRTMEAYLHVAGRTARAGNCEEGGTVVTLATYDEMKRMKSWQTALGIEFEVQYE